MKKHLTVAAATFIAVALLAGCTPGGGPPTGDGTPKPEPTVTVTVTPAAVALPDFGFTFFHQATIGSSRAEMSAQLHMPLDPGAYDDTCPWYPTLWRTDAATTAAFLSALDPASGTTFFYTQNVLATNGENFPRNAEGVGVGSTKTEVLDAYPTAVVDSYTDRGAGDMTRITVDDPDSDSKYVFAIIGTLGANVVDALQWGPGAGEQWSHLCSGF